ncbi:hypothetical protein SDC9_192709 [bioreactor metagenome]|uniref:Uncharacterized protein n=1 Tax=bioreactor metagenome TaxID=1076179 RepID=A0A645I2Z9_9ZZZZ
MTRQPAVFIQCRGVLGMGQRADEPFRSAMRKSCIRVEREHERNVLREFIAFPGKDPFVQPCQRPALARPTGINALRVLRSGPDQGEKKRLAIV